MPARCTQSFADAYLDPSSRVCGCTLKQEGAPIVETSGYEFILWLALFAYGLHILEEHTLNR